MRQIRTKVVNKSGTLALPKYETTCADGMDLMACFDAYHEDKLLQIVHYDSDGLKSFHDHNKILVLNPGERALIPTGLFIALPEGYEAMVRPRSGLAIKYGITVLNSPGCVDADYRGSVGVVLINHGHRPFEIKHGDRIAQLSIKESIQNIWMPVDELDSTERGEGGFGSTGK